MEKYIIKFDGHYCILIPVFYEYEQQPAWRIAFCGTLEECEQVFDNYPDIIKATVEENLQNRNNKRQEYLFLLSINKIKQAEQIKRQYHL